MPTDQRAPVELLIVFIDLTRFAAQSQRVEEAQLADTIDHYYERVAEAVELAGGTLVKFIGDAALLVFPAAATSLARRSIGPPYSTRRA